MTKLNFKSLTVTLDCLYSEVPVTIDTAKKVQRYTGNDLPKGVDRQQKNLQFALFEGQTTYPALKITGLYHR